MQSELQQEILSLQPGHHLCLFYEKDPAEQMPALFPFIRDGLSRNEQFIYIADDQTVETLSDHLKRSGIDVENEIGSGRLKLWTRREWRQPGELNSDRKAAQIRQFIQDAAAAGYKGIRFAVEMTWTLGPDISAQQLEHWEATINTLFTPDFPGRIICQYNKSRLAPDLLLAALHTHPMAVLGEDVCPNPFYQAPLILNSNGDDRSSQARSGADAKSDWMISQLKRARAAERERIAERERRIHDERFERLVSVMPAGVYTCDAEGRITFFNRRAAELWGREPKLNDSDEKFCGSLKICTPDGRHIPHHEIPMAIALRDGRSFRDVEVFIQRPDGSSFIASVNIDPIRDQNGELSGAVNIFQDISKLKLAELKQRHASDELTLQVLDLQRLHSISVRLGGTHDLKSLLYEVLRAAMAVHDTDMGLLSLCDPERDGTRLTVSSGLNDAFLREAEHIPPGGGACELSGDKPERFVVEDVQNDPAFARSRQTATLGGFRALHSTPLVTRHGKVIGLLSVYFRYSRRPSEREARFMDLFARQAADVIENTRLREEAERILAEHKRAEQALTQSEARFKTLADNIAQLAWMADTAGSVFWYNRRWLDYTGSTLEEMTGWGWQKVHHPEHVGRVTEKFKQHIASGEVWEDTFPLRSAAGEYRWFLSRAFPVRGEDGKVLRWFGTNTDITDLQEARSLAERRTRSLELLNGIGNALAAERSLEKVVQMVTDAGRDISGAEFGAFFYNVKNEQGEAYTLYTLSGAPREAFSKFPMPRNTALFGPTFRGEGVVRIGDVLTDPRYGKNAPYNGMPSGHLPVRSYLAAPVVSRSGEVLGGLFFGHSRPDVFTAEAESILVTLAAQAAIAIDNANLYAALERDLAHQKEGDVAARRLAAIVQSSDDAIISKDLNGIITSWNKGAEHIFGYTAEEMIGKPVIMLIPSDRQNEEPEILHRLRRGLRIDHYETVRQRKDGSLVDISLTVSPIIDATGRVIGASKIARDISERRRAEAALQEARDQFARANEQLEMQVRERTASLQEAVAQMEEFSYSISHDLRAPARAMEGYARAVLEDCGDQVGPVAREYLERIARNSGRMDRLIRDLLIYSRISRREVELQPVSLDKLVREVIELFSELQSSLTKIQVREPLSCVLGHEPSLSQVISNLLHNAVKFVAPGKHAEVTVRSERNNGHVRLWVEDNGIGIRPEYQNRLFGMFERVHPAAKYEGTGIGLAIVRKAVERMGGTVGVESDGVNGSRFWIQLPSAETLQGGSATPSGELDGSAAPLSSIER